MPKHYLLVGGIVFALVAALLFFMLPDRAQTPETDTPDAATTIEGPFGDHEYWVTNPTSGSKWYARVLEPTSTKPTTALVLVPGGRSSSDDFMTQKKSAQSIADEGFVVVVFDPEGRGQSEGDEDDNGTIDQDGLKAVVDFTARLDGVSTVGVASFSYGVTMASGMLARYPESPAAFLIDWEGPADRADTGGCDASSTGHLRGTATCDDEAFWAQREAATFIASIRVPYQRMQSETDHAQPDYGHTVAMINNAVDGTAPWVRLNNDEPNTRYTASNITPLPDALDRTVMTMIAKYAKVIVADAL